MSAFGAFDFSDLPVLLAAAIRAWPDDEERGWMLAAWGDPACRITGHAEPGGFMSFRFGVGDRELTVVREHSSYFLRGATIEGLN